MQEYHSQFIQPFISFLFESQAVVQIGLNQVRGGFGCSSVNLGRPFFNILSPAFGFNLHLKEETKHLIYVARHGKDKNKVYGMVLAVIPGNRKIKISELRNRVKLISKGEYKNLKLEVLRDSFYQPGCIQLLHALQKICNYKTHVIIDPELTRNAYWTGNANTQFLSATYYIRDHELFINALKQKVELIGNTFTIASISNLDISLSSQLYSKEIPLRKFHKIFKIRNKGYVIEEEIKHTCNSKYFQGESPLFLPNFLN